MILSIASKTRRASSGDLSRSVNVTNSPPPTRRIISQALLFSWNMPSSGRPAKRQRLNFDAV
jgi:hypothetical protein